MVGKPVDEAEAHPPRARASRWRSPRRRTRTRRRASSSTRTPKSAQKVDEGSTVQLKVSAGAEAIPVPDVVGSQVEQARQLLTGQGFTVKEEQVVDEEAPVGEVVDQDPGPNEEAPRGSEVTLFVSKGPADRPVPDVVGKTIAEASNLLGQAGFTVNQTSEASEHRRGGPRHPHRPAGRHGAARRARRSRWSCRPARRGERRPSRRGPDRGERHQHHRRAPGSGRSSRRWRPTTRPRTAAWSIQDPAGNTTAANGSNVDDRRGRARPEPTGRRRALAD